MPTYARSTKELMKDFAATLKPGEVFTRQDAIDWFQRRYPRTARRMVYLNVDVMATNNISTRRSHRYTQPGSGHDLFFKLDRSRFRLWDPKRDPAPKYAPLQRQKSRTFPSGTTEVPSRPRPQRTSQSLALQVRQVLGGRWTLRASEVGQVAIDGPTLEELRRVATLSARENVPGVPRKAVSRARSKAIRLYALKRAKGSCEGCEDEAPFQRRDGSPYLEVHHVTRLSDSGPDHPAKVIALCPNCHTRAHRSQDSEVFNGRLIKKLRRIESRRLGT
jgi:5-methylcytosine-specific restriction endonuclease McrA